jgi:(R,R)-butanediol dehydrogenase/meso-butanediol dehydrogenase/diacetyl reductase
MRRGARVLVLGAGPIGLATAYWARRRGAGALAVVDLNGYPRDRALAVGASTFIARDSDELPLDAVRSALDGAPEIVFECVGRPGMIAEAISYAGVQTTVVVLGICAEPDTFVPRAALMKEIRLQTSAFFEMSEYLMALDALDEARVLPRALVSDTVSLAALPATFEAMRQRTRECKVLVRPHH